MEIDQTKLEVKIMADIVLAGLDISSRCTGWSKYVNGELKDYGCIDYRKDKSSTDERRDKMCKAIMHKLNELNPDIVVVEEEVIGSSTTTRLLSMIIGTVLAWSLAKNREFYMIQPSQWRSLVSEKETLIPRSVKMSRLGILKDVKKYLELKPRTMLQMVCSLVWLIF